MAWAAFIGTTVVDSERLWFRRGIKHVTSLCGIGRDFANWLYNNAYVYPTFHTQSGVYVVVWKRFSPLIWLESLEMWRFVGMWIKIGWIWMKFLVLCKSPDCTEQNYGTSMACLFLWGETLRSLFIFFWNFYDDCEQVTTSLIFINNITAVLLRVLPDFVECWNVKRLWSVFFLHMFHMKHETHTTFHKVWTKLNCVHWKMKQITI